MSYLPYYILDGIAVYTPGDYDEGSVYTVEDFAEQSWEEIVERHQGERVEVTIRVLGRPTSRRDYLRVATAQVSRQLLPSHFLDLYLVLLDSHFTKRKVPTPYTLRADDPNLRMTPGEYRTAMGWGPEWR